MITLLDKPKIIKLNQTEEEWKAREIYKKFLEIVGGLDGEDK